MSSHKIAGLPYPGRIMEEYCPITALLKDLFTKCREGKKDPNLTIASHASDIKADLARLNSDNCTELAYEYLVAAEQSLPDAGFRYAVLYKDKQPALFVYFQVFTVTAKNFNLPVNKSFVKHIVGLFLNLKRARALVLGNALRTETRSYCYDKNLLGADEAMEAIALVAERIANTDDVSAVILPGLDGMSVHASGALHSLGYSMPWEDNVMEMSVDPGWATIQDYIAALTRKYKTRANKILASGSQLETRQLTVAELAHYQQDMNHLFTEVIDKQAFVFTQSGAEYIVALKKVHKDDFEVVGFFLEGKLLAFSSAFVGSEAYELFYVGFHTELNNEHQLYFNIMLAGLERAIQLRKPLLKLGRTSFDAKASLGAKPRKTEYLVRLRHIPDVAIKWFTAYFATQEDNKWKLRNPLKAEELQRQK